VKLSVTIFVVYVDAVLFVRNDEDEITHILVYFADQFTKVTDLTAILKHMGIDIVIKINTLVRIFPIITSIK
jgi:hypothetical protein